MSAAAEFPVNPDIVNVNITRDTLFSSRKGFGTVLIVGTSPVIDHGARVRFYTSIAGVAADFATTTEEYIAANVAFSQDPGPDRIGIGRALTADIAGFMKTGTPALLASFVTINDGAFNVSIDGAANDVVGCDFTVGHTDLGDVAATIQTQIQAVGGGFAAALCVFEAGVFKITSGTTGAASTVTALSAPAGGTDLSVPLLMNGEQGVAIIADGVTFTDLTAELVAIRAAEDDWYGLTFTKDINSDAEYLLAASWAEGETVLLAAFDNALNALDAQVSSDLGSQVQTLNYDRTGVWWLNKATSYPDVAFITQMLTVDFAIPNSAQTGKFRRLNGIEAVNISENQLIALKGKNINTIVSRGGVSISEEGEQASGEFFDIMHGVDWLEQEIAFNVFDELIAKNRKIPYTDAGASILVAAVTAALEAAVAAGIIATDEDDEGNQLPAFTVSVVKVADVPKAQRANRIGPPITFEARLAGAIHFVTVDGTVTV